MLGRLDVMSENHNLETHQPPFGIAGLACLGCLAVVYLATKPFLVLHEVWARSALVTCFPIAVVFTILYCSSWHRELGRVRRILSVLLSSCALFCCVLLFAVMVAAGLYVAFYRLTAFKD